MTRVPTVTSHMVASHRRRHDASGMTSLPPAGPMAHTPASLKTVRNHVSNILTKLQVSDRAQAIVRAREAGIGQD